MMPERLRTTSPYEARVFRALDPAVWSTAEELAERAQVTPRTAREQVARLVAAHIAERCTSGPVDRYRLTQSGGEDHRAVLDQVASIIVGVSS